MKTIPSLTLSVAERFKYGGHDAVSADELQDALDHIKELESALDDAQSEAASYEDDAESYGNERDEALREVDNLRFNLTSLDNILHAAIDHLGKLPCSPEIEAIIEQLTGARDNFCDVDC
jgi:peptidoglycan hydrolase CwlO-like protein